MPLLVAVLYNLALPYWDTLRKNLAQKGVSSLTILHAPNLIGHPIGIAVLFALGLFAMPSDPTFFLFWFGMIVIASVAQTFNIWGLLETKFFGVQVLNSLGFLVNSIAAVILVGEHLNSIQLIAIALATIGVVCFAWPQRMAPGTFKWDRGVMFVILYLVLSGFSAALYKLATFHTPDYNTFLTGRFVGDLIGWTIVWVIGLTLISHRSPAAELVRCVSNPSGQKMIAGIILSTLVSSWLIYTLPLSTVAMLGTLTIPSAYLYGRFKYNDKVTTRMWAGTALIVPAVLLFIYFR
ncbi:MAG: hypothetical protein Q7S01_05380 [bacterium]|nr:hypothetical protein [bacterium]